MPLPPALPSALPSDELKSWRALTPGRFVGLRMKTDGKAAIRCAEVVSVDRRDSDNEMEVWYYLDRRESPYNDLEVPLHERKLVPEYYGAKDGMVYLAPNKKQIESGEPAPQAQAGGTEEQG